MRVAIVHDTLAEFGGAERVLQALLEIFPNADVFTSSYDQELLSTFFPNLQKKRVYTILNPGDFLCSHTSLFQALSPLLWRKFSFDEYDLVISNSSYMNANLIRVDTKKHIQFIQSPPKNVFRLEPKTPLQHILPYDLYLRPYFRFFVHSSSNVIANSRHMKKVIDNIFDVNSSVIYPPVNIPKLLPKHASHPKYFLCIGRIDRAKSLEIPIIACTKLGLHLKIVGKTNEVKYETYLRSIAGPCVEFLGAKTDKEISSLYKKTVALIFSSKCEDFGIVPIEAMAHGVPVISFYGGGPKETIIKGVTGDFYYQHTASSLIKKLKKFNSEDFSPEKLYNHAKKFRSAQFKEKFVKYINALSQ